MELTERHTRNALEGLGAAGVRPESVKNGGEGAEEEDGGGGGVATAPPSSSCGHRSTRKTVVETTDTLAR